MKLANRRAALAIIAVACLWAWGCADAKHEKTAATGQTEFSGPTEAPVLLEDGVYPVVLGNETVLTGDAEVKVVELDISPVEGSEKPIPDKLRIIARPLLRFRNVHFEFTFEKNECTEVGFQNTDELKAYTRDHVGSRLAVVIDNKVITHHKIREALETDQVRITCCTVGGGDHLHKHLKELKLASDANRQSKVDE